MIADQIIESPDAGVGLVGHYPLDPMGPRCRKGHRGCAEAMLSIPTISAQVSMGLQRAVSYEECLELASAGNPVAVGVVTDAGRALGRLIAAVANLTMTARIILTGEGIRLADVARDALEEGVKLDRHPDAKPVHYEIQPLATPTQWARGRGSRRNPTVCAGKRAPLTRSKHSTQVILSAMHR